MGGEVRPVNAHQCNKCAGHDYLTTLHTLMRHPRLRARLDEWPEHKTIRVVVPHLPPDTSIDQRSQMQPYVGIIEACVLSPFAPTLQETLRIDWKVFES
jgi:hypothetical protein